MLVATLVAVAVLLVACGGNDDGNAGGNGTDAAFIDNMVDHHQSAIDMAKIAQKRSKSPYVKGLADDIVEAQKGEITVMEAIGHDLEGVKKADLGMTMKDMGMHGNTNMLETATPFDRDFIDMMIPHHQGAIRMARIELARGKSKALKNVADKVIAAQTREINEMNAYRKKAFGATSPAGGVPAVTAAAAEEPSEHDGHAGMAGM